MTFPGMFPMTFFQTAAAAPAGGIITRIQPFTITIASGAASNTATILSVDNTRTIIFPAGLTQDNSIGNQENSRARTELTDATTITAYRAAYATVGNLVLCGTAVEFNATGVDSVQYGTTALVSATNTGTTTIASANVARTAIFNLGYQPTGGASSIARYFHSTIQLTNPTTITATREDSLTATVGNVGWILASFTSGAVSIQHQIFTSVSAGTSEQHAIPSNVNPARTMLAWGGNRGLSSTEQDYFHKLQLSSSAATTVTRDEGSISSHSVAYNTIEFNSSYINSIQRGTLNIVSSALSNTAAITSANTSKSALSWAGYSTGGDQPNEQDATAQLTNATTITASKGGVSSIGTDNSTVAWEVVQFI